MTSEDKIKNIRQPPTGPPPSSKSKEASVAPVKKQSSGRSIPRKTTIRKDATRFRGRKKGCDVFDRVVTQTLHLKQETRRDRSEIPGKRYYYKLRVG